MKLKSLLAVFIGLTSVFSFLSLNIPDAFAVTCNVTSGRIYNTGANLFLTATGYNNPSSQYYIGLVDINAPASSFEIQAVYTPSISGTPTSVSITSVPTGTYDVEIRRTPPSSTGESNICTNSPINVTNAGGGGPPPAGTPRCSLSPPSGLIAGDTITVSGSGFTPNTNYTYRFTGMPLTNPVTTDSSGVFAHSTIVWTPGTATVQIATGSLPSDPVITSCGPVTIGPGASPPTGATPSPAAAPLVSGKNPCTDNSGNPINCPTAIGSIPTDPASFTGRLLTIAVSIAGGIALILMVRGSIKILMAAGDPQKIQDGRDMIVAALAGLLFLIFSVLVLQFLGSDLLRLFSY